MRFLFYAILNSYEFRLKGIQFHKTLSIYCMKKNLLTLSALLTLCIGTQAIAQTIPNGDLETWTSTTRDTLVNWKGTIGVEKIVGKDGNGSAVKIVTTSNTDIASLVSGNISCITGCSGDVKGVGVPLNSASGILSIKADFASSQNGAVAAVAFFDANGTLMPGGVNGYYVAPLSAGPTFASSTVSVFITSATPTFGTVSVPAGAVQVIIAFFPEATDPSKSSSKTVGSYISIDNLVVKAGLTTLAVPNADFEQWTTINTDKATGWNSSETYMLGSLTKSNQSNAGSAAAKITTASFVGNIQTGVLSLGSVQYGILPADTKYFPEFKINKIPNALNFSSKYVASAGINDTAAVEIILTRNVGNVTTKVGSGYGLIAPSANFKAIKVPIAMFQNETVADSAIVLFYSSRGKGSVDRGLGSVLWVDDVSFGFTTVGINDEMLLQQVVLSPNPAKETVVISNHSNQPVTVTLKNISGQALYTYSISEFDKYNLNTAGLGKGIYLVEISNSLSVSNQKLVIE